MHSKLRALLFAIGLSFAIPVFSGPIIQTGTNAPQDQKLLHLLGKMGYLAQTICDDAYPKVETEKCFDMIYHAIMSARDPHSAYLSKKEYDELRMSRSNELEGIGVQIRRVGQRGPVEVVHVFEGTPAFEANIRPNDLIVKVGDKPVSKYETTDDIVQDIRGKPGTQVRLSIERKDVEKPINVTLLRKKVAIPQIESKMTTFSGKKYLVVETKHFGQNFAKQLAEHVLKGMKQQPEGLILEYSGNPGGDLSEVILALDLFYDAPSGFVSIRSNDGVEVYDLSPAEAGDATPGDITKGLPILVVVNGQSASASEIFAGGMQMNRAPVAGTRTWAKGSVQNVIPLNDGSALKFTMGEYVVGSPTRYMSVQCKGIIPDLPYIDPSKPAADEDGARHECDLAGSIPQSAPDAPGSVGELSAYATRDPVGYANGKLLLEVYKAYRASKAKTAPDSGER
ncbi:MAG TPA: S41 family peptidase [Candidatus Paceibacterota bacterium]|nr:S41 family peptidase [Candidatus Paceibacterota bacterium]